MGLDSLSEGAILPGKGQPIVKYRDTLWLAVQKRLNRSTCCLGCGLTWAQGITHSIGVQIPLCEEAILGERTCPGMPDDTLTWAVQKWLNRSRCRLGCGLGWADGSMCYMGAHWRCLNGSCLAAMRRSVTLICGALEEQLLTYLLMSNYSDHLLSLHN